MLVSLCGQRFANITRGQLTRRPLLPARAVSRVAVRLTVRIDLGWHISGLHDVPTVAESGFPGFEAESWTAISGPPKMPAAVVLRINEMLIRIAQMPDVREKFATVGLEASLLKPDAMKQFIKQELDKWGKAVRSSGATID